MGVAGAGALAQVLNAALGNRARFNEMQAFFEGVGAGHAAGVWQETPQDHPQFRERYAAQLAKAAAKRKAEEMI
jgi:chlorophyllide a reductase subunit Y